MRRGHCARAWNGADTLPAQQNHANQLAIGEPNADRGSRQEGVEQGHRLGRLELGAPKALRYVLASGWACFHTQGDA